ncbi:MAG TPA: acyl carrier protein [Holophagaceae bacterium]|nr:acyl carrier protein [Holophagaceae bacterium]
MLDEVHLKQVMGSILQVDPSTLGPDASNDTLPGWDSLKHMSLVLALEEEYGVSIPDEDAANITSYALIKLVLEDLLKGR